MRHDDNSHYSQLLALPHFITTASFPEHITFYSSYLLPRYHPLPFDVPTVIFFTLILLNLFIMSIIHRCYHYPF
jgi:hypothetical protein